MSVDETTDDAIDSLVIQIRVALEHELGVRAPDDIDVAKASAIRTVIALSDAAAPSSASSR